MKDNATLHLLFNHTLTQDQKEDAHKTLHIENIVYFPSGLLDIWREIPAQKLYIKDMLYGHYAYMSKACKKGDYILIQGDAGATFLMVQKALSLKLIPIYATTKRQAIEKVVKGKSIKTSIFEHVLFRKYGE
ncbi:MAG: Unknown protein [uncultured Sulfurovum sp.]|uniref:Uncharacterized protein n=1 Tax=uncultured Sulfurovum sp. TaxID=269237 RepID=A0A6S6S3A2_9BACT|nr:MAG: Unknown protein [uncultured Sulfurovum sp.]